MSEFSDNLPQPNQLTSNLPLHWEFGYTKKEERFKALKKHT